ASAAGDEDFASGTGTVFQDDDAPSAPARLDGAHESGGSGTDDDCINSHCIKLRIWGHALTFWQRVALCWHRMTRKVLLVTGDGGDSYEALYGCQRFSEA